MKRQKPRLPTTHNTPAQRAETIALQPKVQPVDVPPTAAPSSAKQLLFLPVVIVLIIFFFGGGVWLGRKLNPEPHPSQPASPAPEKKTTTTAPLETRKDPLIGMILETECTKRLEEQRFSQAITIQKECEDAFNKLLFEAAKRELIVQDGEALTVRYKRAALASTTKQDGFTDLKNVSYPVMVYIPYKNGNIGCGIAGNVDSVCFRFMWKANKKPLPAKISSLTFPRGIVVEAE